MDGEVESSNGTDATGGAEGARLEPGNGIGVQIHAVAYSICIRLWVMRPELSESMPR